MYTYTGKCNQTCRKIMEDRNSYREEEMNDQSLDVKYIESEER